MDDKDKRIAELERQMAKAINLFQSINDSWCDLVRWQTQTEEEVKMLFRNDLLLYEKVRPVFEKLFPNNEAFLMEFRRVLGPDVGPEDNKRP